MKRIIVSDTETTTDWIKPLFDELPKYKDNVFITDKARGAHNDRFNYFNLVGTFVGFDGVEYVALVKVGMFNDRTYLKFSNFTKNYHTVLGGQN